MNSPTEKFTRLLTPIHCPLFLGKISRPTDHNVTVRVLFHRSGIAHVIYGLESDKLTQVTQDVSIKKKEPFDFVIDGLQWKTRYYYRLVYRVGNESEEISDEYTFHTQRDSGESFVFSVQSDSHLDENTSGEVYLRTLANALSDSPDVHFELGDTFMTGKYVKPELSEPQYIAQRYYLGSLCHSSALFFALGNHDGEGGSRGTNVWATKTRKRLFPNPTLVVIKRNAKLVCPKIIINGNGGMRNSSCSIRFDIPCSGHAMATIGLGR